MKEPIFNIGDKVYHSTPDSNQGIIVDICYFYRGKTFKYLIATSFSEGEWCVGEELSEIKIF